MFIPNLDLPLLLKDPFCPVGQVDERPVHQIILGFDSPLENFLDDELATISLASKAA